MNFAAPAVSRFSPPDVGCCTAIDRAAAETCDYFWPSPEGWCAYTRAPLKKGQKIGSVDGACHCLEALAERKETK